MRTILLYLFIKAVSEERKEEIKYNQKGEKKAQNANRKLKIHSALLPFCVGQASNRK